MKIATLLKMIYAVTIILGVASIASLFTTNMAVQAEREAFDLRTEQRTLGREFAAATRTMTEQARLYSIDGDKKHLDTYTNQVNTIRTYEKVVRELTRIGAPPVEMTLITEAKNRGDAVNRFEQQAIEFIQKGEIERGRAMLHGEEYDQMLNGVNESLKQYTDLMNKRVHDTVAEAGRSFQFFTVLSGVTVIVTVLLFLAILYFVVTRRMLQPITRLNDVVQQLAGGNYQIDVPGQSAGDEIGDIAKAVNVLKDSGIARLRLEEQQVVEQKQRQHRMEAVERLVKDFEEAMGRSLRTVSAAATELTSTSQSMSHIADQTSSEASSTASAAEQTTANVQAVASATEEMTASLQEISQQISRSSAIANQAVREATQADTTVNSLSEAAQRIGEVIELIQNIASQTNLLALNATIEAARAGEAGKGFAVVASEVKNLATQTARATEDISSQINAMQQATNVAVQAIRGISGIIADIDNITTSIASAVEEQGAVTSEIARNVQEAASGTQSVSQSIIQVTMAASQTQQASSSVHSAASSLSHEAEGLRNEVDRFLQAIRVA